MNWIRLVAPTVLCGVVCAQSFSVAWTVHGAAAGDLLGRAVDSGADFDGDGVGDVLTGAYEHDPGGLLDAGRADIFRGTDGTPLRTWFGAAAGDDFGHAVAALGDVDGDGVSDAAVGAPGADQPLKANAGAVYVYSGATGAPLFTFLGEAAGDSLGYHVAAAGDVNADGAADLFVGARFHDLPGSANRGRVYLVSGATGLALWTRDGDLANAQLGSAVAGVGDVDGDGLPDVAAGAHNHGGPAAAGRGRVVLLHGATGATLRVFDGETAGDFFGWSVAGGGDADGDGCPEILVGAYRRSGPAGIESGKAYVYCAATGALVRSWDGPAPNARFGWAVATGGDLDQGGGTDFVVGAPHFAGTAGLAAGRIYAYHGESGALLGAVDGAAGENLGISVSVRGDVDGDGFAEIMAGALYADGPAGLDAGAMRRVDLGVGAYADLGFAKAGVAGPPLLLGTGSLVAGLPAALRLSGGAPSASALLVLGFSRVDLPALDGVLIPSPDLLLPTACDATGAFELAVLWPAVLGPTTPLYAQAWIADASATFGLAASNGLSATAAP